MDIKFIELALENFKSHQQLTVNFGERTEITGDNAQGKSSIGEAITFLLYGIDLLGSKLDPTPVTYDADATHVSLLLEVDGKQVKLGREIIKGRNKYIVNDVPSKATEYNQVVEQFFDKELFLSLFNPNYFFTMHWEKQREMLLSYVTLPANKEVFKVMDEPQTDKLAELVKKHNLDDLEKIHRENKRKKDKEIIAAASRTKTLQEQLDGIGSIVPMSSLRVEKSQLEKKRAELDEIFDGAGDVRWEIQSLKNQLDNLTMQIDQGKERHTEIKNREIEETCHTCGQELQGEARERAEQAKEKELSSIAGQVNPLIIQRRELTEKISNITVPEVDEKAQVEAQKITDKLQEIDFEMRKHSDIERLEESIKESKENERAVRKSLNESIFILDAIKAFHAKEAELQANKVQGLFENLSIKLFEPIKTTGELKATFSIQMDGKDYVKLSLSEGIRAGLELRDVLSEQSGVVAPCFVDNAESITKFKAPNGQLVTATVVAGSKLNIESEEN